MKQILLNTVSIQDTGAPTPITYFEDTPLAWEGGSVMGLGDKFKHAAEKAGGKGKEAAGDATDNDRLKAEGKTDQVKAEVKQAADKVKGAFKKH